MASAWGNRTLVARMSVAICGTNRCGEDDPGYRCAHPGLRSLCGERIIGWDHERFAG